MCRSAPMYIHTCRPEGYLKHQYKWTVFRYDTKDADLRICSDTAQNNGGQDYQQPSDDLLETFFMRQRGSPRVIYTTKHSWSKGRLNMKSLLTTIGDYYKHAVAQSGQRPLS